MKALKIAAAGAAVVVAGIFIVLATFDVDQYKGLIEAQAKTATGRNVTIGDIDLSVSLTPAIVLTDVKMANATWGSRAEMIILPRVEVHTQLVPLLFGTINLTKISAEKPDILLEVDKQGRGNWEFDTPPGESSTPLNVGEVAVTGLKLGYRDMQTGRSADVEGKAIAVEIEGALQQLNVSSLNASGLRVAFKDAAAAGNLSAGALALTSQGAITDLGITSARMSDAQFAYKGAGEAIELQLTSFSLDEDGKVALAGKLAGQDVKVNGTLAPVSVLVAMNKAFPAKVEVEGYGLKATSDVTIAMENDRLFAKGSIVVPEIDLSKTPNTPPVKTDGRLFSADPLPWDMLTVADADVNVSIGKVTLSNGFVVTDVTVPVTVTKGRLTASPVSVAVAGGSVVANVGLNAQTKAASLKAEGKGFTAEGLAKALQMTDAITQGPIDLSMDVRGAGNSVREIMATLDGAVVTGMGESRMRNDMLNIVGADVIMQVLSAVNPVGNKDPYTVSRCGVVNLQIADGVARTTQGIALVTDKMQLIASGQIDLGAERIDLSVSPRATSGLGVGLGTIVQSVRISGPLADPSVGMDKANAVKTLGALGAAFATGGASLFAQGAKGRIEGAGDPCQTARTWHIKK